MNIVIADTEFDHNNHRTAQGEIEDKDWQIAQLQIALQKTRGEVAAATAKYNRIIDLFSGEDGFAKNLGFFSEVTVLAPPQSTFKAGIQEQVVKMQETIDELTAENERVNQELNLLRQQHKRSYSNISL